MAWAAEWAKEVVVVVHWRKLLPPKGYLVLPRRWVVEVGSLGSTSKGG